MKYLKSLLIIIAIFLTVLSCTPPDKPYDILPYLQYSDYEDGIEITGINRCPYDTIIIPEYINNKPVRRLGVKSFAEIGFRYIELPSTLREIGSQAFEDYNTVIDTFVIPEGVTTIENNIFGSTEVHYLHIPSTLVNVEGSFCFFTTIDEVILSPEMTEIPDNLCYALSVRIIDIPDGVKRIGKNAFAFTDLFHNIRIPNGCTTIDDNAFEQSNINSIVIPDTVTYIGEEAFYNCTKLKEITIPSNVENIGRHAFGSYNSLETRIRIIVNKTKEECKAWPDDWFDFNCEVIYKSDPIIENEV